MDPSRSSDDDQQQTELHPVNDRRPRRAAAAVDASRVGSSHHDALAGAGVEPTVERHGPLRTLLTQWVPETVVSSSRGAVVPRHQMPIEDLLAPFIRSDRLAEAPLPPQAPPAAAPQPSSVARGGRRTRAPSVPGPRFPVYNLTTSPPHYTTLFQENARGDSMARHAPVPSSYARPPPPPMGGFTSSSSLPPPLPSLPILAPAPGPASTPALLLPTPSSMDPDNLPQAITRAREEYRWSISLYTVQHADYEYAQSYLDDLYFHLEPDARKWFSHTTRGFMQDGNRLTFLVLHNAANPFTDGTPPRFTTSIGVYGLFWYCHEELHWTTFAPDMRSLLSRAEAEGHIRLVRKWTPDMRPSEKRFHRAYWLAANMLPLGNLLNRCDVGGDAVPHDAVEVFDDGFEVQEEDCQRLWTNHESWVDDDDAKETWEEMRDEAEHAIVPEEGYEHVFAGEGLLHRVE